MIKDPSTETLRLLSERSDQTLRERTQELQVAEVELERAFDRERAARLAFEDALTASRISGMVRSARTRSVKTLEGLVILEGYSWDYTVSPPVRYDLETTTSRLTRG